MPLAGSHCYTLESTLSVVSSSQLPSPTKPISPPKLQLEPRLTTRMYRRKTNSEHSNLSCPDAHNVMHQGSMNVNSSPAPSPSSKPTSQMRVRPMVQPRPPRRSKAWNGAPSLLASAARTVSRKEHKREATRVPLAIPRSGRVSNGKVELELDPSTAKERPWPSKTRYLVAAPSYPLLEHSLARSEDRINIYRTLLSQYNSLATHSSSNILLYNACLCNEFPSQNLSTITRTHPA